MVKAKKFHKHAYQINFACIQKGYEKCFSSQNNVLYSIIHVCTVNELQEANIAFLHFIMKIVIEIMQKENCVWHIHV